MIELLVVMAIMGILTIITVSQFGTAQKKARDAQRKTDLSSVSKALLMYYADYNVFPPETGTEPGQIDLLTGASFTDSSGYLYMKVMPKENKLTNCPYRYLVSDDQKEYAVLGCLENIEDKDANTKADPGIPRAIDCGGGQIYNYGFVSPNINIDEISNCSL